MKAFLCYTTGDSEFVIQVAKYLRTSMEKVFYFEDPDHNAGDFVATLEKELVACDVMLVFANTNLTKWQEKELHAVAKREPRPRVYVVFLEVSGKDQRRILNEHALTSVDLVLDVVHRNNGEAHEVAQKVLSRLGIPPRFEDGLPYDPHLFSYEKNIIDFFRRKYELGDQIHNDPPCTEERKERSEFRRKLLDGCPVSWPHVQRWPDLIAGYTDRVNDIHTWRREPYRNRARGFGKARHDDSRVVVAALSSFHDKKRCMIHGENLCFPEAGPREHLFFPPRTNSGDLNVALLVAGGIAPGINAVIDGIVQRHSIYAREHNQLSGLTIYGLRNGFRAFDSFPNSYVRLADPNGQPELNTSEYANQGGAVLGTSRVDELINRETRMERLENVVNCLRMNNIDILYVIGGDGSMKAAHAIWSVAKNRPGRPLSVVGIPKTMDNDILWVWQAFGFLSAVEKARETLELLYTEVKSNPRLCILQMFGSDSGFVVSHSVLASGTGHCDVALIPEVPFSMKKLAEVVKQKMCARKQRIPFGLIVMAETAIPTDASDYVAPKGESPLIDINLSRKEQDEIINFEKIRQQGKRIQGQTNDILRMAGLKIVSSGLARLLPGLPIEMQVGFEPDWNLLRVFNNEPRHLLRAIPPSSSDIIIGQRLGMLAVDNAMAGYTDYMISQWLTEYVLVPLELVVLGRKRIPNDGIFWRSVLAKTGQPEDMAGRAKERSLQ